MSKLKTIEVQGTKITLLDYADSDFISLTDIARSINERTDVVITNWMRNRNTVEFLGVWEQLYNPDFNPIGFDGIRIRTGLNNFFLTVKQWIGETNAIGIQAKTGRYGGTYAHKDIAFEFCSFVNPVFKLYLIREFQRLKDNESKLLDVEWDVKRIMAKASYPIHTEAVRQHLVPPKLLRTKMEGLYFANEADLLNLALFGMTAKDWKLQNPDVKGNLRDNATHEQLLVLSLLQGLNAKLLEWGSDAKQRLELLNKAAIEWMQVMVNSNSLKELPVESQRLGGG